MRKILIFSIILFIVLCCCNTLVKGANISMDLDANQQSVPQQNQNDIENETDDFDNDSTVYGTENENDQSFTDTSIDAPLTVGTSAALSSSDLALSSILNIILIVLGILLVLLAIAILIRLH